MDLAISMSYECLEEGIVFAYNHLTRGFSHESPSAYFNNIFRFPLFLLRSNPTMPWSGSIPIGKE